MAIVNKCLRTLSIFNSSSFEKLSQLEIIEVFSSKIRAWGNRWKVKTQNMLN